MKKIVFVLMVCALGMMSCESDYLNVKNGLSVRLYHEESHQIDAESKSIISYRSDKDYHATVNEQGLVTANYVGKTNVVLTNESGDVANVEVDVIPVSNLYPEPNLSFGETEYSVFSKYGMPDVVDDDYYFYADYSPNAPFMLVSFDDGMVDTYSVLVNASTNVEELETFLDERYKYLFSTEENIFYMNALSVLDATMSVGVGVMTFGYEVYILVVYMDGETYKSTSNMEEIKDKFMKYVNGFMNTH